MILDDRLQKLALSSYPSHKAKQAILSDLLEIIGTDIEDGILHRDHITASRIESLAYIPRTKGKPDTFDINDIYELFFKSMNELRQELRKKVKKYCD